MKEFSIKYNRSVIPDKHKCLFMEITSPELSVFRHLNINCISFVHWFGDWMIERNGSSQPPHIDFYWVYGSGFTVESAAGKMCADQGDLVVVPSWFDRRQTISGNVCPHIYLRCNNPELFPEIKNISVRRSILEKNFCSDVIRLINACTPLFPEKSYLRMVLGELVYLQFMEDVKMLNSSADHFREDFFHAVNKLEHSNPSVAELAHALHLSESALHKKCMASFCTSPGKILIEHRMNIARNQLLSGMYSLNDIALLAGYSDLFAFSKAFRKHFGTAPSVYRKNPSISSSIPERETN